MGTSKTARSKLLEIFKRQGKLPDQIPELMTSKHDRPKKQQGARNALPGYLQNCMTLFMTALLVVGIWVTPSVAEPLTVETTTCTDCHKDGENWLPIHNGPHPSTPGSGWVTLFADTDHDDAGWFGDKPYFDVLVDCSNCHTNDLRAIHANDCYTCHNNPDYESVVNNWDGGCQQGGCHQVYHEDSTTAHLPWENAWNNSGNDCTICHAQNWDVSQSICQNCHATYGAGDHTPPVTTTNALENYIGPAKINFSIWDNGSDMVGIGRTFYQLDGGPETAGMNVFVSAPGPHDLVYWSIDQSGNKESPPNELTFTIIADTEPPVTTSNARATYNQGARINLSANDNGTPLGVKTTHYTLSGGAYNGKEKTGTIVWIPATNGTIEYTLRFWSVDWAGNIETVNEVTFTCTGGTGTIRLIWYDCDVNQNHCPSSYDWADWSIRIGSFNGPVYRSSGDGGPNWSGVNDIAVAVSPIPYFVRIDWYYDDEDWDDQTDFPNVYVTTPGQIIRLNY